ncbi:MAG: hypothetical protein AAF399_30510 [Bacteroidota bacterium]
MKPFLKYLTSLSLILMMGTAMAQQMPQIDTDRYEEALEELDYLKAMNKSDMTKTEKQAWKRKKKITKQVIRAERAKIEFAEDMADAARFNRFGPGFYGRGAFMGGMGFHPYFFTPRPRVVVVQPSQKVPVPRPQVQRPRQARRPMAAPSRARRSVRR